MTAAASKQARWREKKLAEGLCPICGKEPMGKGGTRGDKCRRRMATNRRLKTGGKPWRKGKPGRPPKDAPKIDPAL